MALSSSGVVLLTMTTAPLLGFTWIVNSLLLASHGERFVRVTVMSVNPVRYDRVAGQGAGAQAKSGGATSS